jgi:hypothetical protein
LTPIAAASSRFKQIAQAVVEIENVFSLCRRRPPIEPHAAGDLAALAIWFRDRGGP